MNRRDFLQAAGVAGAFGPLTAAVAGKELDHAPDELEARVAPECHSASRRCEGAARRFAWCRLDSGDGAVVAAFYGGNRDVRTIADWLAEQERWLFEQETTWPTLEQLDQEAERRLRRASNVLDRVMVDMPLPDMGPRDTFVALFDCDDIECVQPCVDHFRAAHAAGVMIVLVEPDGSSKAKQDLDDLLHYNPLIRVPWRQTVIFRRSDYAFQQSSGESALEAIVRLALSGRGKHESWFEIRPEGRLSRRGYEVRKLVHKIDVSTARARIEQELRKGNYSHFVESSPSNGDRDEAHNFRLWGMIGRMDELQAELWHYSSLVVLSWGSDLELNSNMDALIRFREALPPHACLLVRMRDARQKWLLAFNGERLFEHYES